MIFTTGSTILIKATDTHVHPHSVHNAHNPLSSSNHYHYTDLKLNSAPASLDSVLIRVRCMFTKNVISIDGHVRWLIRKPQLGC